MMVEMRIKTPSEFINPLLEKRSIESKSFEDFKKAFEIYKKEIDKQHTNGQAEPNIVSNALKPFMKSFDYTAEIHSQNGQSGIDLALKKDDTIKVIIEAKKKGSKEMISKSDFNHKALHEAVLYFMREVEGGNNAITHIIITDFYQWFVFDAKDFERLFLQNKQVKQIFKDYNDPNKIGDKTKDFYDSLQKYLGQTDLNKTIDCAYFNIEDFTALTNQRELISLAKLLSADTLYKEFNPNDANSLNKEFYTELLYILGLEEVKDGGKKLIKQATKPQHGSFYENIANKLAQYGKPTDFETIIKLIIIWINRILFLKLLESQLIKWNANPSLKFLDITKINDYDKLEMLFFEILAKRPSERIHEEFDYIPYLNSSLFEIHENETKYLTISNLSDDAKISYYQKTVIKDEYGKKKLGQVSTLAYLFEFLDSYDFGSTTTEEIVNVQKSLINASVLGLIFEKINGYKDGSFYTPSFITMYMARESIQKTVIEKLNRTFEIEASSFDELINYCNKHNYKNDFIAKASYAINSITICDPAVGSGHFLVSALNELIYIKYQLGLFSIKGLHMSLANDELLIKLENEWFEYTKPQDFDSLNHKLQKLLFEEKQKIIENQLFGVDINPNSSQITKLRLWIELLKNSYYKEDGLLETLPNIDINIKTGNSLISRFELQDKLKINNITEEIKNYKQRVSDYKNNLGTKKEVLESIASLKDKFKLSLKAEAKIQKEFDEKLKNYYREFGFDGLDSTLILRCLEWRNQQFQPALFGDKDTKKQYKLLGEITKLQSQIDEIEQGKIYEDAFEWRFEFPEVLDDEGNFKGFDIVIGNPPYIDSEAMTKQMPKEREYYSSNFETAKGNWDLYIVFLELSLKLGCDKSFSTFIIPNKVLSSQYGEIFRAKVVKDNLLFEICDVSQAYVFEEADVYPIILSLHATQKTKVTNDIIKFKYKITESKYINWAYYLEENIELYEKIKQIFNNIKNTKEILTASSATVAEAYELAEVLKDDKTQEIKVINTGTIDPYISLWGIQPMQYIKKKYLYPTIMKSQLKHKDWTLKPKIIIAGMGLRIEAFLDELGIVLPAKSTVVVYSEIINLKFLLALLNSSLYSFLFKIENKFTGMAGGYMNFNQNNISKLPFVISENQSIFIELVDQILEAKKQDPKADTSELERQIDMMVYELYGLSDDEIAVIEGKQ